MLIEDFSSAVYWRIAAIFSTIAALFSVAVVFWFLIFRDNPDLPDDTDPSEKTRFLNDINRKKSNNLLEEILEALKNLYESKKNVKSNFMRKMEYLIFGSSTENGKNFILIKKFKLIIFDIFFKILNQKTR